MTISSISTAWMFDLFSRDVFKHCSSMLELGPQDLSNINGLLETYCTKYNLKSEFNEYITQVISNFSAGQFTRHLYGYRDNSINVRLVERQIKQGIVVPELERTE